MSITTRKDRTSKGVVVGLGEWMLELMDDIRSAGGQEQVLQRQFLLEGAHWA